MFSLLLFRMFWTSKQGVRPFPSTPAVDSLCSCRAASKIAPVSLNFVEAHRGAASAPQPWDRDLVLGRQHFCLMGKRRGNCSARKKVSLTPLIFGKTTELCTYQQRPHDGPRSLYIACLAHAALLSRYGPAISLFLGLKK